MMPLPSSTFLPLPTRTHGPRGACPEPAHAKPPNQGRSPLDTQFPVLLTFFVPYFSRNSKPELEDRAAGEAERKKEEDGRLGRSHPISPSPNLQDQTTEDSLGKYPQSLQRGKFSRIPSHRSQQFLNLVFCCIF